MLATPKLFLTTEPGSLVGSVWLDLNRDRLREPDEPPVPGVLLELLKDGQLVASTTTNSTGHYVFDNLLPGNYMVKITTPAGTVITAANHSTDPAIEPDFSQPTTCQGKVHAAITTFFIIIDCPILFCARMLSADTNSSVCLATRLGPYTSATH